MGFTQKAAADLIGINDYQLGNYETNRSEPSLEILKKMSQAYCVSIDKLLNNDLNKKVKASFIDDDGYIDVEALSKQLSEIAEQLNKASNK